MFAGCDSGASAFFQGFIRIDAGSLPGRSTTKEDTSQSRRGESEQQDGNTQPYVRLGRQIERYLGHEHLQHDLAQSNADRPSQPSHDQAFNQKLTEDVRACSAN